jgi:hypothetical protein
MQTPLRLTVEDFVNKEQPRGRSRLAHYDDELRLLKARGYGLDQMREFLKANGITVTVAAISAYFKKSQKSPLLQRV